MPHDVHRKRRAAISSFFSKRSVTLCEPIFHRNIELLCASLQRHLRRGEPVDIRVDYLAFTLETIYNAAFGVPLGVISDYEQALDWKKTLDGITDVTPLVKQYSWILPLAMHLPPLITKLLSTEAAAMSRVHQVRQQLGVVG